MVKVQIEDPLSLRERGSKQLKERARKLRRTNTEAESCLWRHLRGRRLAGYKFRRQVIIEPYIATDLTRKITFKLIRVDLNSD
ncbi:MAG: DUF559 domain-containing protein [Candidatus Thiodiazotropha sp.]